MPQAKTSKKKPTSKVGGGGVGTRVSKLNLKIVIPVVVVVAALGGFYIFRKSGASAGRTFTVAASNMHGGKYVQKSGIPPYREVVSSHSSQQSTHATVTAQQSDASSSFCVRYSGSGAANVLLNYYPYWGAPNLTFQKGLINKESQKVYTERTTCVSKPTGKNIVSVQIISTDGVTRVIEIYGKP